MKLTLYFFDTWGNPDDGYDVTQNIPDNFCYGIDYKKLRDIFEIPNDVFMIYDGGNNVELFDEENGKPLGTIEMIK